MNAPSRTNSSLLSTMNILIQILDKKTSGIRKHLRSAQAFTLMELLIVIAILGILMGLLFPAVNGALNSARKAQAKNDVVQIANAVVMYETEYGTFPTNSSASPMDVGGTFLQALMGTNPRRITFIEVPDYKKNKGGITNGNWIDPWTNAYKIVVDTGYSNQVTAKGATLRKRVAVWNDTTNTRLSVTSWD